MASTYQAPTLEEVDDILIPLGFKRVESLVPAFCRFPVYEFVYDKQVQRGFEYYLIRVFSSISRGTETARKKGKDRIRIVTLRYTPGGNVWGAKKTIQMNRTKTWADRLKENVRRRVLEMSGDPQGELLLEHTVKQH